MGVISLSGLGFWNQFFCGFLFGERVGPGVLSFLGVAVSAEYFVVYILRLSATGVLPAFGAGRRVEVGARAVCADFWLFEVR